MSYLHTCVCMYWGSQHDPNSPGVPSGVTPQQNSVISTINYV